MILELSVQREIEIKNTIQNMIENQNYNRINYRLQSDRKRLGIYKIFSDVDCPVKGMIRYFSDKLIILIKEGIDDLEEVIAHEIGHIQLEHIKTREMIAKSSKYALWERICVKNKKYSTQDSTTEKNEANYFSKIFCEKLNGVNWLDGLEIISLSQYK